MVVVITPINAVSFTEPHRAKFTWQAAHWYTSFYRHNTSGAFLDEGVCVCVCVYVTEGGHWVGLNSSCAVCVCFFCAIHSMSVPVCIEQSYRAHRCVFLCCFLPHSGICIKINFAHISVTVMLMHFEVTRQHVRESNHNNWSRVSLPISLIRGIM